MLRERSRSERYSGCTTEASSTSGSSVVFHACVAWVVLTAPEGDTRVSRTSCSVQALPCCVASFAWRNEVSAPASSKPKMRTSASSTCGCPCTRCASAALALTRSEEHTSELQSPVPLVCRLLLEKKTLTRPPTHPTP